MLIGHAADWFIALVHAGRYWEAARLAPVFDDLDLTATTLAADRNRQLHLLYCRAVLGIHTAATVPQQQSVRARLLHEAQNAAAQPGTVELGTHFRELAEALT